MGEALTLVGLLTGFAAVLGGVLGLIAWATGGAGEAPDDPEVQTDEA